MHLLNTCPALWWWTYFTACPPYDDGQLFCTPYSPQALFSASLVHYKPDSLPGLFTTGLIFCRPYLLLTWLVFVRGLYQMKYSIIIKANPLVSQCYNSIELTVTRRYKLLCYWFTPSYNKAVFHSWFSGMLFLWNLNLRRSIPKDNSRILYKNSSPTHLCFDLLPEHLNPWMLGHSKYICMILDR